MNSSVHKNFGKETDNFYSSSTKRMYISCPVRIRKKDKNFYRIAKGVDRIIDCENNGFISYYFHNLMVPFPGNQRKKSTIKVQTVRKNNMKYFQ